ncbi:MAG: type II toxin-antitoxin system PemK/MazF family toxin [Legionellaceae bacterium]|nr:type II toxin-antitoxin system PemK/MazF family toxin [Legionellaceae bacterium]
MKRGTVYWINLDPTKGSEIKKKRPCVIVGATPINKARRTVVVVPLSTAGKSNPPIVVAVQCDHKDVVAVCDQVRTVDKSRFEDRIGELSIEDMDKIDESLRVVLSL